MDVSEYQPTKEETLFLKYYDKLIKETTHARAHLKLWQKLVDYRVDYLDELNQSPHFFQLTIKAHLDNAILTISRILDKHGSSLSIWKFLNYVEQNRQIFSIQAFKRHIVNRQYYQELVESHIPIKLENIQEHRSELDNLNQVINDIKKWRDRLLAHTDRRAYLRSRNVSIKKEQIDGVIDIIARILNKYSNAYHASTFSIQYVGEDDVQGIMDAIRFKKEEEEKQIEALLKQAQDKRQKES